MNPAKLVLKKQTITTVLIVLLVFAGWKAYFGLGRLENPDFVIKLAVVFTPYPGASPEEVEQEVTDPLEEAIQALGQRKRIWSISQEGLSVIYFEVKPDFKSKELPQIWDELRRKVNDAQIYLPPGAGPSIVNDDFGDVFGVFYALSGEGYSYEELKDYADELKKEILLCKDVAKVAFWGVQREVIYIEMEPSKMAELGISPTTVFRVLQSQNAVAKSGKVQIGEDYVRITPTGDFTSEEAIGNLLFSDLQGRGIVRLRDVATIRRGFQDPPNQLMYFNGKPAIGIGISTVLGGNVLEMGEAVRAKLQQLKPTCPAGMELGVIADQAETVDRAVGGFVLNLFESIAIVIVMLMIFMGWRTGLLIGAVLLLTILATFCYMWVDGIALQKISLGALILALGMLVDNAIVVAEGILIRIQKGEDREKAAIDSVAQTQWPLLGATVVAILAFAAIGFTPGNVGEFCQSLFKVMAASLLFSWLLAVTVTPLLCYRFLPKPKETMADPYDRPMFRIYRRFLHRCLRFWQVSFGVLLLMVIAAVVGFSFIPHFFFSPSTQPQFLVDYWRPQGTHIEQTAEDIQQIQNFIAQQEGVTNYASFVGEGALRFILPYDYTPRNSSYGQVLVTVDDYEKIANLIPKIRDYLNETFPDSEPKIKVFENGPAPSAKIEAEFRGPDVEVLYELCEQAKEIMREDGDAVNVRDNWRQMAEVKRPVFSESIARRTGITRSDLANALQMNFSGLTVGLYREENDLLPIVIRPPEDDRASFVDRNKIHIWSPALSQPLPFEQVVQEIETVREPPMVRRRNRVRMIQAQCDPGLGTTDSLLTRLRPKIEAIPLPPGYELSWEGELYYSSEANSKLAQIFPVCLLGMFVILIGLFNALRQPIIIFLTLPLSIIGVTAGLLIAGLPFGFMSILGFLGLSGMLIKNAIVLMDEIDLEIKAGKPRYQAVLDSGVSRMRPVIMASGTTVFGMTPLVWDPFYAVMATTVAGGLIGATVLTLIVVPMFYCLFYRIKPTVQ